jgi:hypothetical protein
MNLLIEEFQKLNIHKYDICEKAGHSKLKAVVLIN